MSNKQMLWDSIGWGFLLWLIGYVLGILLFFVVPANMIGWVLTPIGFLITVWVALKVIKSNSLNYYMILAIVWTLMAVILDYLLLVQVFKPEDGYYKLDVYIYYFLTFTIPLVVGFIKASRES